MAPSRITNICCVGAGYVGGPTCAVIAAQNPHIRVVVTDLSESRIAAWKSQQLPIFEPGLLEIVQLARDGTDGRAPNLHFSTDVATAIDEADLIFIAVNTPTKTAGLGAGSAADLAYFESAVRMIAQASRTDKIIVEKSTVPCGTADSFREILQSLAAPGVRFDILSNPEFLAEGTAMNDLLHPDRVLIGSLTDEQSLAAAEALGDVYGAWVPRKRIITVNLWSSELAKLAANCMLAQRISSINSFSAICEATGANIEELSYAIGQDSRIGSRMLKTSVGFGGSCFKKDVLSLVYIAETLHLPEIASYWRAVVQINQYQMQRFTKRIVQRLYNTLAGKRIAVLGFAYKKNTGDTRESAAITVVRQLLLEKAHVSIYDPQVSEKQILWDMEHCGAGFDKQTLQQNISVTSDATAACQGASAIVILTEWDDFKTDLISAEKPSPSRTGVSSAEDGDKHSSCSDDSGVVLCDEAQPRRIDWTKIAQAVQRPKLVFDGRNVVESSKLAQLGFTVESIGRRS